MDELLYLDSDFRLDSAVEVDQTINQRN